MHRNLRATPEQPPTSAAAGRSVGLDIVRSVAIGLVLLSHCSDVFCGWFGVRGSAVISRSGFFGVELFFVLSGFLIGRLLIEIVDRGPGFRAWLIFMQRRWMRTLPLYLLWLGVLALVWPPHFWEPGHYRALWRDLPWFATCLQNLAWPVVDGWFAVSWSLTVEEWFYLLFSACVIAGAVVLPRRPALGLTVAAFLAVPLAVRWHLPLDADWDHFTSQVVVCRLDAIAFGVVVAWMYVRRARVLRFWPLLLALGVGLIGAMWGADKFNSAWLPGLRFQRAFIFDLASVGFALCLPAAAALRSASRWIAVPARAISAQSYGMYVMHLSILEIVSWCRVVFHWPTIACVVLSLGLIWILSWAAHRWFEAPIMALRPAQRFKSGPVPADAVAIPGWPARPVPAPAEAAGSDNPAEFAGQAPG